MSRPPKDYPNHVFIDACIEFDVCLAQLISARQRHFDVDAEGQRTDKEGATARRMTALLKEALALAGTVADKSR